MTFVAAGGMSRVLQLALIGPLRITRDGQEIDGGPRQRQLVLGLLMARAGQTASLAEIEELLWPDHAPSTATNVVHHHISRLRRLLEPELASREPGHWLARTAGGYRLAVTAANLDLLRFRDLRSRAQAAAQADRPDEAMALYKQLGQLWRGPCLAGLEPQGQAALAFSAVDDEMTATVSEFAGFALGIGKAATAIPVLRQATQCHSLDESLRAQLLLVLAATGKQAEAVESYHDLRRRLRDELGIDPGVKLQKALETVLRQDLRVEIAPAKPSVAVVETPLAPVGGPVVATSTLRPAQLPPDLPFFTGRSDMLADLAIHLSRGANGIPRSHVICIDGLPGCGKSATAVRLAHQFAGDYPDGQLYADLQGFAPSGAPVDHADVMRGFLAALGLAVRDLPAGLPELSALFRSVLAGRRVLIVLDNARDSEHVANLLPGTPESTVIVTSRTRLIQLRATTAR